MKRIQTTCFFVMPLLMSLVVPVTQAALPNGVAAGDVTDQSVVLWANSTVKGPLRFEWSESADFSNPASALSRVTATRVPVKVTVSDLKPGTPYYYRATDFSGQSATGTFRTSTGAAAITTGLHFGVSGDIRPELNPYTGIRKADQANLDFFVCLGDCIYAENYSVEGTPTAKTLPQYRAKYQTTLTGKYGLNTWTSLRGATAQFAMIDDHEVINDFSGAAGQGSDERFDKTGQFINETRRYGAGLQAFGEFMPITEETWSATGEARDDGKPKLYRNRRFGQLASMSLIDTRSFRDQSLPAVRDLSQAGVGAFLVQSFDPTRTLLGKAQLATLKADLKAAQEAGVTWKFVMIPEPIQNLGVVGGEDRYEGFAAERTDLLRFIKTAGIHNVVFVSADIHGTVVNNLTYEEAPMGPKIPVDAFEISTGPIAFDQPFGPTVADLGTAFGLLKPEEKTFYDSLPVQNDADDLPNDKDDFIKQLVNGLITQLGYDPIGLSGSTLQARLIQGDYLATHTYGWTGFEIDAASQTLRITTYGVPAYTSADLKASGKALSKRQPEIVSQFEVTPTR
jgi:phosphodiesterase/alkaline phosphatase D-like protein